MEKYFDNAVRIIAAFTTVILIFAVLLVPEPRFKNYKSCSDNTLTKEEACGLDSIEWKPSIAQRLKAEYKNITKPTDVVNIAPNSFPITENWNLYKNDEYNFTFKYPETFTITNEKQDRFTYMLSIALAGNSENIKNFDIRVIVTSDKESLDNLNNCTEYAKKFDKVPAYNFEGEKLNISHSLLKLDDHNACMEKMYTNKESAYKIFLQENEKVFTIQFSTEGNITSTDLLVNQILSTFNLSTTD